jgi:hypothetical protein
MAFKLVGFVGVRVALTVLARPTYLPVPGLVYRPPDAAEERTAWRAAGTV